jgi:glucose/arabinose dehydrogenase
MERGGTPRAVADVGSPSGALAVGADGSLLLADGSRAWRMARPDGSAPGTDRPPSPAPQTVPPSDQAASGFRPRPDGSVPGADPSLEPVAEGLGNAFGMAIAGDGTVFVSDHAGGRVLAIAPAPEAGEPGGRAGGRRWAPPALVASGLSHPSGLVALPDGALLVKESGRHDHGPARLIRVERNGKITPWTELRRDETR